jgi:DNA-directed RNA polymerase specialized sigma24 family protein
MTRRPTAAAVQALADNCRRRAASLWHKRFSSVDRDDFEGHLSLGCVAALIDFDPKHTLRASIETFAISKIKTALARENVQARFCMSFDQQVDEDGEERDGELALYLAQPDLYERAPAIDPDRVRERLALLPPTLRDFAYLVVTDAVSTVDAAALVGITERMARYNVVAAVEALEAAGGHSLPDLFGGCMTSTAGEWVMA